MGNNFHTPWEDGVTRWQASSTNPLFAELDRGITYLKNVMVHCDGRIYYNRATGTLTWTGTLRIHFITAAGLSVENTVAAGSVTLSDNQFAYVDLSETDGAALTVSAATISTGSASNFVAYNRLVLGIRNAASDNFYPVWLKNVMESIVVLTSGASVTVNWDLGHVQKITLAHNVSFTFSGGYDGQRMILRVYQDSTGHWIPTWPGSIRYPSDIPQISLPEEPNHGAYLGFIFDGAESRYDLVSVVKSYGQYGS